jgi:lipopolysaccharide transport system permease protein
MVGIIDGFRWSLLGSGEAPGGLLAVSVVAIALILGSGLYYFRRMEATFADVI